MKHRGPDDTGTWFSSTGQAAFAHTRLSILDLSPAGRQPMTLADGRYAITFNGEIYNFRELRRSLEQAGVEFHTGTDTEVILRAYETYGVECVSRLRGMFAFALWDERERTCLFARDRFGIKPLFYHSAGPRLVFASEIRALLASGLVPAVLDLQGLYGYFRSGSVPEPRTLLQDVRCLDAGHTMVWSDGRIHATRFWDLCFAGETTVADPVRATREALVDSIDHHFVSDVPVGIFLSGGIDSTALVALARASRRGELRTFSITFPGSPNDEGAMARRTAEDFGTAHREWPLGASEGKQLFNEFLTAVDQPSIDGFNTFAVARLASLNGTKVVMSGLGGDEMFGGYPSFRAVPRLAAWNRNLQRAGPLWSASGRVLERFGGARVRRIGDLMSDAPTLAAAYATFRGIYTRAEARALTRHYGKAPGFMGVDDRPAAADATAEDAVSRLELTHYMRNQLLRDADVMSMASGVELRVPFLDSAVMQTVAGIAARDRLAPGKSLLRRAVPEVPDRVAHQRKRGFLFPIEEWLKTDWQDVFASLDHRPVAMDTWYRKWSVFCFERWLEKMHV